MPTINQLSAVTSLSVSDLLPVYSSQNGDARKASLGVLLDWIEASWKSPDMTRVTASPSVNGTTIALPTTASSIFLLVTPTAGFASLAITLPLSTSLADGQIVTVYTTQSVGALTLNLNGATAALGTPVALAANSSFTLRYDATSKSWYAIARAGSELSNAATFTATLNGSTNNPTTPVTASCTYTLTGKTLTLCISMESVTTTGAAGNVFFTTDLPAALRPAARSVGAAAVGNSTAQHNGVFADFLTNGQIALMQNKNGAAVEAVTHSAGAGRLFIVTGSYIIA